MNIRLRNLGPPICVLALAGACVFGASPSRSFAADFVVPSVFRFEATFPATQWTPEIHTLCIGRAQEVGGSATGRLLCYGALKPETAPSMPPDSFETAIPQDISGTYSPSTGLLIVPVLGCEELVPGFGLKVDLLIPLDKGGGEVNGNYVQVITENDTSPDCVGGTPLFGAMVFTPLAINSDSDGDGCTDWEELGTDQDKGGLRDPLNPWDYFDTDGNSTIDLFLDLFNVAFAFGLETGEPGYSTVLDRGEKLGPNDWNMDEPDGTIDLFNDVFGVAFQFGHSCQAAP